MGRLYFTEKFIDQVSSMNTDEVVEMFRPWLYPDNCQDCNVDLDDTNRSKLTEEPVCLDCERKYFK